MNPAAPKSWIQGLEVFNELLDVAPDGVAGNVGIDCPGEEEPFVEESRESVEFRCVWGDFGSRERLERVVPEDGRRCRRLLEGRGVFRPVPIPLRMRGSRKFG